MAPGKDFKGGFNVDGWISLCVTVPPVAGTLACTAHAKTTT